MAIKRGRLQSILLWKEIELAHFSFSYIFWIFFHCHGTVTVNMPINTWMQLIIVFGLTFVDFLIPHTLPIYHATMAQLFSQPNVQMPIIVRIIKQYDTSACYWQREWRLRSVYCLSNRKFIICHLSMHRKFIKGNYGKHARGCARRDVLSEHLLWLGGHHRRGFENSSTHTK